MLPEQGLHLTYRQVKQALAKYRFNFMKGGFLVNNNIASSELKKTNIILMMVTGIMFLLLIANVGLFLRINQIQSNIQTMMIPSQSSQNATLNQG
ncbi:MAG: hypothetical protein M5U34_04375 [Chloroflexi bacterium]|nr:hypothetical protein [Chloroflexota bacterium]